MLFSSSAWKEIQVKEKKSDFFSLERSYDHKLQLVVVQSYKPPARGFGKYLRKHGFYKQYNDAPPLLKRGAFGYSLVQG
jgi:hypothetical protein